MPKQPWYYSYKDADYFDDVLYIQGYHYHKYQIEENLAIDEKSQRIISFTLPFEFKGFECAVGYQCGADNDIRYAEFKEIIMSISNEMYELLKQAWSILNPKVQNYLNGFPKVGLNHGYQKGDIIVLYDQNPFFFKCINTFDDGYPCWLNKDSVQIAQLQAIDLKSVLLHTTGTTDLWLSLYEEHIHIKYCDYIAISSIRDKLIEQGYDERQHIPNHKNEKNQSLNTVKNKKYKKELTAIQHQINKYVSYEVENLKYALFKSINEHNGGNKEKIVKDLPFNFNIFSDHLKNEWIEHGMIMDKYRGRSRLFFTLQTLQNIFGNRILVKINENNKDKCVAILQASILYDQSKPFDISKLHVVAADGYRENGGWRFNFMGKIEHIDD